MLGGHFSRSLASHFRRRTSENAVMAKFVCEEQSPFQKAQDRRQRQQISRAALGGGDSEGARLGDCSDCSTEARRKIYAKWVISFYSKWTISLRRVCALITARRGKGERRFGAPPSVQGEAKGRSPKAPAWAMRRSGRDGGGCPTRLRTTDSNILAIKRCR
jgi:hypothetical protein